MLSFILCVISIIFVYSFINRPKSTYIIRTLNDENSIEGKLRLAMLKNSEIIVIDSGSTDDTLEIVKKMKKDYPIITLIENQKAVP